MNDIMKERLKDKRTVIVIITCLIIFTASPLFSKSDKTKASVNVRNVTIGAFTLNVPADWQIFSANESAQLRRQYIAQEEEIYRQYYGAYDQANSVDIAAFHFAGHAGTFVIVTSKIPPRSDLINLLKKQAEDKAKWGIQQKYIKKYLGLVSINDKQFSGFIVKCVGNSGEIQISGGLENKKLKGTLLQLTLLCPGAWDETKAVNTITSILESAKLGLTLTH